MTKFTVEVLNDIRDMLAAGKSVKEIAKLVGSTQESIAVICSTHGISRKLPPIQGGPNKTASVNISMATYKYHAALARKFNITPSRLMAAVITVVATDDLFKAIIDERKHAPLLRKKAHRYHRRAAPASQGPRNAGNGAAADHERPPHPSHGDPDNLVLGKVGGSSQKEKNETNEN